LDFIPGKPIFGWHSLKKGMCLARVRYTLVFLRIPVYTPKEFQQNQVCRGESFLGKAGIFRNHRRDHGPIYGQSSRYCSNLFSCQWLLGVVKPYGEGHFQFKYSPKKPAEVARKKVR